MDNDFLNLVWLLKTNQDISREDLEFALTGIDEVDFEFESRRMRFRELLQGSLDGNPDDFASFQDESEGLVLFTAEEVETELRLSALELYGESWKTPLYEELFRLVLLGQKGEWDEFEEALEAYELDIQIQWDEYSDMRITEDEVTQETAIGHRLLLEGLQALLNAISLLFSAADEEVEWAEALETAEWGSRLLTMSHLYALRVART